MNSKLTASNTMYHIGLSKSDICNAEYALLPGDPARVERVAAAFGTYKLLNFNREYKSALIKLKDKSVLVCSTGMGGPSMAIGLEEMSMIGVKNFIRIGTTGAITEQINLGDIIFNSASVRLEGTSKHYAPIEYPAVASPDLLNSLIITAKNLDIPHHVGIGVTSDTFWPGQERYEGFSGYVLRSLQGSMSEWKKLHVLNYEMENAALFTIANTFGLRAASACLVVAKRTENEKILSKELWKTFESRFYNNLIVQSVRSFLN